MVDKIAAEFTERIQKETKALKEKEEQIKRERELLEEEKLKMGPLQKDEVIEVNVGGEVFATKRRTLLQAEGTMLEAIFSGRWEGSLDRDKEQRVFLDFTPALFRSLLSYLRARRDAKPGQTVPPPTVPNDLKCEFESMVGFLDLSAYMRLNYLPAPDALTCRQVGAPDATMAVKGHVLTRTSGSSTHLPMLGQRPLVGDGADRAIWRVTLRQLDSGVFAAGVAENPDCTVYNDATSYIWAWSNQVWVGGANRNTDGWTTWQAGDVGIFQLDAASSQLKMYHRRTARLYTIAFNAGAAARRMHLMLSFYNNTTVVEVEPASQQDLIEAGFE